MTTIAIGSKNPVKIAAVRSILSKAFLDSTYVSFAVPSGVSEQPWGEAETQTGAINRAKAALGNTKASYGVGLEGGLINSPYGLMTCAWCVIIDKQGKVGHGGGLHFLLPPVIKKLVDIHGELGPAMDALIQQKNTKQKLGAIGILTNGLSNRQTAYEQLVVMAAAPFVSNYYNE